MDDMYSDVCTAGICLVGEGISIGDGAIVKKNSMVETNMLDFAGNNIREFDRNVINVM